jgi:hypothetical protein
MTCALCARELNASSHQLPEELFIVSEEIIETAFNAT